MRAATDCMDVVVQELTTATPQALQRCAGLLERAGRDLIGTQSPGALAKDPASLAAVLQLRGRIRQAGRLLQNVWLFHERWGRLLGAQTGGYLAGGKAAPILTASRLFVRG